MDTVLTSTEAARHLGDVLAKVRHAGQSFVVTKGDKPVARLVPVPPRSGATGAEIMEALARLPHDPTFAADLERANRLDSIPANPWA